MFIDYELHNSRMRKLYKMLTGFLLIGLIFAEQIVEAAQMEHNDKLLFENVYELQTYKTADEGYANAFLGEVMDIWKHGCSSLTKIMPNGDCIVGRNMDMEKRPNLPAYVVRTEDPNCYKTVGLMYFDEAPYPIPDAVRGAVPYIVNDAMNEKGLYIDIHTRDAEQQSDGSWRFECTGTNSQSQERVFALELVQLAAQKCATVDEVLEYVKILDLYTMHLENGPAWSFSYTIADATGHYGVLELADNRLIWHDGAEINTNYYLYEELLKDETRPLGIARANHLRQHKNEVKTEADMMNLLDQVTYHEITEPENPYDIAIFSVIANCTEKKMTVRFFEDSEKIMTFGF